MKSIFCKCGELRRPNGQKNCLSCHAAGMRKTRSHTPLSPEQRLKMNARCYANVYQRRGKLIPQPCAECGETKAQKHHEDYSKPLEVIWLCRECHLEHHHTP